MKKFSQKLVLVLSVCLLYRLNVSAASGTEPASPPALTIREVHYEGKLSDDEAYFTLDLEAEATGQSSLPLLAGDVAVLPSRLPDVLKIVREGDHYLLTAKRAGHFKFQFGVVAKIQHSEPWNQISFTGPMATIASVAAQAAGADTEVQLLNGTLLASVKTNGVERTTGFLGADQTVALRWQAKVAEVVHQALLTVDSTITAQITPTVIKYTSKFHYDVVQGDAAELTLTLPAAQALTHLDGSQIRDWHITTDNDRQTLTVEFIKPIENSYDLTLYSEQPVENTDTRSTLDPPQPLKVERESGLLTISAEDMLAGVDAPASLNQVNAPDNAIAAYQFNGRPLTLALTLKPVEPEIAAADRVSAQLEEARLVVLHNLTLDVEKAGVYSLELTPQTGFSVADVRGDGIEDWNVSGGKIHVNFSARVLGAHPLTVQLEQALKTFPDKISLLPLRVTGAEKESAQIGAASVPGIQLRTGTLAGLREIPINRLPDHSNEILAYTAEQPDWTLSIACEKLTARVVADVFNLVTIGDGSVGGSATIRYGLANQGVQAFKVRVPATFKNVEFTGPNIRRSEQAGDVWTIGLQDKAWGGYTLVVTYDEPFDPKGATLAVGGVHALDVERETGSVAVTTAVSLQLTPQTASNPLRRIDETELSAADRSFITRPVVLAYQYTGGEYDLSVEAKHYDEVPVLEAVADRTQITSVLTAAGEMLTQASFMVKNNAKQFQRFELPQNAKLWGCYVNGQPAKPERDGDGVLVSLPHEADRDQAFTVDIMYAQTNGGLASTFGKSLAFNAPRTDVPNTYAEWQLFVPPTFRLSDFGGSMNVAQGTTYELLDAWEKFLAFYGQVLHEAGGAILFIGLLAFLVIALVISAVRRGWNGVLTLFAVMTILAILSAMLLPALSAAKRKSQRISSVNNLKEIGLATRIFSGDNNDRLPRSFEEMTNELSSDKITYDVETGQRFTYLGDGMAEGSLKPDSVIAYSPVFNGHCEVLYADGSVDQITADTFAELSQRGLVQLATPPETPSAAQPPPVQREAMMTAAPADASYKGQLVANVNGMVAGNTGLPAENEQVNGLGGFGGQSASSSTPALATATPSTTAGIRSIRIDLPESGQPFLFTKVLNIGDEPLSIRARIMPLHTFQSIQMAWQTVAFLIGLAVWCLQWRRPRRSSFVLSLALALIIGSVCSLLVQWRALHDALIIGFPVATLAILAIAIWKYWPRGEKPAVEPTEPWIKPSAPETGMPPVVAAIILLLALSFNSARAADVASASPMLPAATVAIVSANYSGTADDRVASVDATLRFSSTQAGQIIPLFGDDVAVEQFSVKNGKAELVRANNRLAVQTGRGDVVVEIKLLVKIAGDVTKRQLVFAIPPALSSQVSLALNEAGADVDFPSAISFQRILEKDRTRVEAVIGSADHIELAWTPRVKRAEEIAATMFCQNAALVSFGGGVMDVRATLDYQISQGELRQARVQLPAGQRLLRVEGDGLRTWEIKNENGAQILVVDLLKGMVSSWRLVVETEKNLDALPASVGITVPQALDVKRETGLIALRGNGELGLAVESAQDLQRVDADEFARAINDEADNLSSVFQFSRPEFSLRARIEAIQPEIAALVQNNVRVGGEQAALSATIHYTIKRAGVFALKVALPAGYRVDQVTGNNIQQQNERDENGGPVLEVTLKDRTSGDYTLQLELTRNFKELPPSLAITGVYPLNTAKLTGFVAVTAEPGVAVKTGSFDGLTEIPAGSLPDYSSVAANGNVLAYKFIAAEPNRSPDWKLSVATESVAAWVRAEIVNTLSLADTLAGGRALIRYNIANAPVKELRVRVPAHFQNIEITGANIRSREQDGNVWRVELQSPVRGVYTLTVTWEQPDLPANGAVEIAGVTAEGVDRETGVLAISAKPPLQVGEATATGLQRVDTGDFPDWAGSPDTATALAYRYVRPGYQLTLAVRRLDEAEVLQAIVESAQLTSVVADDGQMMTEMSLSLQSNGRQFLEVQLPPGANVWSAFVAGQAVRPSLRAGRLLLPIKQSAAADGATTVELTYYAGTNSFPRERGAVGFASPQFDVPLKNARWEIYLPPNYDYKNFQGTMTRELAPAPESATTSFSILQYSRMEQESKSVDKLELTRDVSEARRQLDSGNVREANASLDRARTRLAADGYASDDVKQLQKDLQSAQASNLVAAQNAFTLRNSGSIGGGEDNPAPPSTALQYDSAAAGEQWAKLQQAQEILTTKVQPLRVNLPIRGLHFAFAQVLQTETGKPMTIQLFASSTKAVSWPLRGLTILATFLCLWIVVAILCRLTSRRL